MPGRFLRICMNLARSHQCTKYSKKKNSPRQSNILGSKWKKCNTLPEVFFSWKRQFWERNDIIIRAFCCDSIILRRNISLYNYFILYNFLIFLRNDRFLSRHRCYISGALGQSECLYSLEQCFSQNATRKNNTCESSWSGRDLHWVTGNDLARFV